MPSDLFAFDFDGVICESAPETGLSAWRAACALWPERFNGPMPAPFLERFVLCRPAIETGYENIAMMDLLMREVSADRILERFAALAEEAIGRLGLDVERMRAAFGAARDAWIADDAEGWLDAQGFYDGVIPAINGLTAWRCVITTKQHRFTVRLAERAGLEVPPERIFAQESFINGSKRDVIEGLLDESPGARVHFFEDRMETLRRMRDLDRARLYLVDWGYNTAREREEAREDECITLLDRAGFEAVLAGH